MSDEKNKAGDIARSIWLAGVGAYGKAVEEAQERLEKAMEPPKLFRDLVKVGSALEEDARVSTEAVRHSVEERISSCTNCDPTSSSSEEDCSRDRSTSMNSICDSISCRLFLIYGILGEASTRSIACAYHG